jgi:hypothetical protein
MKTRIRLDADENTPLEIFGGKSLAHAGTTFVHTILDCVAKGDPVRGATPRSLMQMIGTEWGRERIAQDVWIKAWLRQVAKVPEGTPVVVDDCRFPNEAEACMRAGQATFFRVTRGTETRLAGAVEQGHESERHVLGHHYVISNNFHPRDAGEQVRHLLWDAAKRGNPALKGLSAA